MSEHPAAGARECRERQQGQDGDDAGEAPPPGGRISFPARQRQAEGDEAGQETDDRQHERDRGLRGGCRAGLGVAHDVGRRRELHRELPAGSSSTSPKVSGPEVNASSNGSPSTSPKIRNVYGPAAVGKKTDW